MMGEFAGGVDDSWALQAIVGGGGSVSNSCYGVMDDLLFGIPDMLLETRSPPLTRSTEELDGVFNQPVLDGSPSNSSSSAEQKQTCTDLVQSGGAVVNSYVPKYKLRR